MNKNKAKELFKAIFDDTDLELTDEKFEKLCDFENLLIEKNKVMNLTAITDSEEIWVKHFVDSISLLKYVEIKPNSSLIDVGCGAGFPSIPCAVMRPDLKITMLDSLMKRVTFLDDVINKIDLKNCTAVHGRAEELGKDAAYREKFDFATARAVANMPMLCEYCLPFVNVGGFFAALKGPSDSINSAENAINKLGGKINKELEYNVFENERKIFLIEKANPTPKQFPRIPKNIKNKPL